MPLTYVHVDNGDGSWGQLRYKIWDVTFDNSYPTGGELVDAAQVGLQNIVGACCVGAADIASAGVVPFFKPSTGRILATRTGAHSHVLHFQTAAAANAVTAAANQLRTAAAAFDVAGVPDSTGEGGVVNAAQVAMTEVANATDLSAITLRLMFVGN